MTQVAGSPPRTGDKAGSCSSPSDCSKPAAARVPAPVTELGVRSGGVLPHAARGAAAGPGHPPPWERPRCGCEGPGYSISAEISCSGCAVLDTASPWKPSRSGCAGSGDAISTETRLRRPCRPGCAGRAPGAHSRRVGGAAGCGVMEESRTHLRGRRGAGGAGDGVQATRPRRGDRRDREIGGSAPVPTIPT